MKYWSFSWTSFNSGVMLTIYYIKCVRFNYGVTHDQDVLLTKVFLCICSCWVGGNSNPICATPIIPNVYPNFNKLPTNLHVTFMLYKCSNSLICWYLVKHAKFSQCNRRVKTCNWKRMYKDGHHKLGQIFDILVHFSPMYVGILFGFKKLYVHFSCECKHFHCSNLICMV